MSQNAVKWYQGFAFKGTVYMVVVAAALMASIILVINFKGKKIVMEESIRLIEQVGNTAVSRLNARSREIKALTRNVGISAENLPKDLIAFHTVLPTIIDYNGDWGIAGGGYWPEPFGFTPGVEKRSFFWGREADGRMLFFDDYNQPDTGYHNQEWYVVVRYTEPGQTVWSRSYMDPHSYQPMVTCTIATHDEGEFSGTATIDLKLDALHDFANSWKKKISGYTFILDRNNKFITYPEPSLVQTMTESLRGKAVDFITASDFAKKEPRFQPLAAYVEKLNKRILKLAMGMPEYRSQLAKNIFRDSPQINEEESKLIAAMLADPFKDKGSDTFLIDSFFVENDPLLKEKSLVSVFHVPDAYWKFVVVEPYSKTIQYASNLVLSLTLYLGVIIVFITGLAYLTLRKALIIPLLRTTRSVQRMEALIAEGKIHDLEKQRLKKIGSGEIGFLSFVFKKLADRFIDAHKSLRIANDSAEAANENLSELIKSEREMASKAQAASQAKSNFLNNVSHELRTPMNAIMSMNQFLLEMELDDDQAGYSKTIQEKSFELLTIIDDILDFSEIETGRLDLDKSTFYLDDLIKDIVDIVREKNFELVLDISPEIPNALAGDILRLKQILKNLMNNACKFSVKNSEIILGISTAKEPAKTIVLQFYIQDTGIGIAANDIEKLFKEPFTQVDASSTRQYEGLGLGLIICKSLVEMMDGKIWIESVLDKGTTVLFTAEFMKPEEGSPFDFPAGIKNLQTVGTDADEIDIDDQVDNEDNEESSADPEQIQKLLENLARSISESDPVEINHYLEQVSTLIKPALLKNLTEYVSDYDFENALLEINKITDSL